MDKINPFVDWFGLINRIERSKVRLKEFADLHYSFDKYWIHYGAYWVSTIFFINYYLENYTMFGLVLICVSVLFGFISLYWFYKFIQFSPLKIDLLPKDLDECFNKTEANNPEASSEQISLAVLRWYYNNLGEKLEEAQVRLDTKMTILGRIVKICSLSLILFLVLFLESNFIQISRIMMAEDPKDALPPSDNQSTIKVTPPSKDRTLPMGKTDSAVRGILDEGSRPDSGRSTGENSGGSKK